MASVTQANAYAVQQRRPSFSFQKAGPNGNEAGSLQFQSQSAFAMDSVSFSGEARIAKANREMVDKIIADLNERIGELPGFEGIENLNPADHTPEATADRIVTFATSFLPSYGERHADEGEQTQLDGFMALIRGGIEEGFRQARGILEGLDVLNGTVKEGVDSTYDLVMQGLDRFYERRSASFTPTE